MRAPHGESKDHTSKRSGSKLKLHSSILSAEVNTPASTLSLEVLPSDLTPVLSPTGALVEASSKLKMRSPSMPDSFSDLPPGDPPRGLHYKLRVEVPNRSKTDTLNSIVRTFSASKALNQVLGIQDPGPFVPPPAISSNLAEKFEAGLQGYEQLYAAGVPASSRSEGLAASVPSQQCKTILADILEEKESPVRPQRAATSSASSKLKINVPTWRSEKQAMAVAQRYTLLDSNSDAANDTASQHTDHESDDEDYSSWKYGSSTTLAVSDYSRPGSAANEPSSPPPPSFPSRTSSLLPLPNLNSSDTTALPLPHLVSMKLPPELRRTSTQNIMSVNSRHISKEVNHAYGDLSALRRHESLPMLFPSPGVEPKSRVPVHNETTYVHHNASSHIEADDTLGDTYAFISQDTASSPAPRITIQAPSPVKVPTSRKRAPSLSPQEDYRLPLSQRARRDDTAGLPVLSLDEETGWEVDFPGNTHALLTILLTWSHSMWIFYRRLHDSKLFSVHPAFAYPITPPVRKQLLSVSFYSTSVEPHKEIRFMGPGDVAEMSYHEVDVFDDLQNTTDDQASPRCSSPIDIIKQTFGLTDDQTPKYFRYMSMSQRAKTGEGRWCYILIKDNSPPDGGTPPHLILAWHVSAVTTTSDCLHTIYADSGEPNSVPTTSHNKVKRFSSLQNLGLALRSPAKFNLHRSLRTASSSSELPPADPYVTTEQREGVTLHRTVLKMQKAGGIPLVEGFRVDVTAFKDWMEACGRGEGKVIMWADREGR